MLVAHKLELFTKRVDLLWLLVTHAPPQWLLNECTQEVAFLIE